MAEHGSDTKQGPGWWIASDGRWYAPETHPDYRPPPPPPTASTSAPLSTGADDAVGTVDLTDASASDTPSVGSSLGSSVDSPSSGSGPLGEPSPVASDSAKAPTVLSPPAMHQSTNQQVAAASGAAAGAVAAGSAKLTPPPVPPSVTPHAPLSQTPPSVPAGTQAAPPFQAPVDHVAPTQMPPTAVPPGQGPLSQTAPPPGFGAERSDHTPRYEVGTAAPAVEPRRRTSVLAGLLSIAGGLLAIVSSFMVWAVESGAVDGFDLTREVVAFDSNGVIVAGCGVGLIILGVLMLLGIGRQVVLAVLAILCGGAIIVAFVYSFVDITGSASDDWVDFVARGTGVPDSVVRDGGVGLTPALGLWLSGVGGLLGALSAPFVNRADS